MPSCPACGSAETSPWKRKNLLGALAPEDLRITDARYGTTLALEACKDCGFLFAEDPALTQLGELYAALDDPAYDEGTEARTRQLSHLLDVCLREEPGARTLLDVGAATGLLVTEAARLGLDAIGIEPSRSLSDRARSRGANVISGTLPHPALEDRAFDIVTLVDVVEHVSDPVGLCRAARDRLAPGGLLVVVTPDVASIAARHLGHRWWHFRVAHVGYFSRTSFSRAASRAGLSIVGTRRARWFFPLGYLLERVTRYVPIPKRAARALGTSRLLERLRATILPLNLFDSTIYFLRKTR
jgi:2-polyprenyl-3-methyl-5-hydroxy-6-metoxy-1,4-benzoquinol methylase